MKTKFFASIALLLGAAGILSAGETARPQPALEKGMDAAAIRELIGQPAEVRPMKSADVKAEQWIYRRKVTEGTYQTANTQAYIPAMVGVNSGGPVVGRALVPDYRLKYVKVYQVTALLLVDGKLERGRQWNERDESFAD